MANESIYLMSGEELVKMRNQPYESEVLLQELLAQFLTANGVGVCQFFPGWDSVEIPVHEGRASDSDARVDAFFEKLRSVSARRKPAQKFPNLVCADVVDSWEGPSRELLDEWLDLIQTAAQPGQTPFRSRLTSSGKGGWPEMESADADGCPVVARGLRSDSSATLRQPARQRGGGGRRY